MPSKADRLVRFIWVTTVATLLIFGLVTGSILLITSHFDKSRFDDFSAEFSTSTQDGVKLKLAAKDNQIKR